MVKVFIENIIASATLSSELDLEGIQKLLPNCEYNPDRFPGLIYKPEAPQVVVLLFNSGKIMVTAAKSVGDVEQAMNTVEKELKKANMLQPVKEQPEKASDEMPGDEKVGDGGGGDETKEGEETPNDEKTEDKGEEKVEEAPAEEKVEEKPEEAGGEEDIEDKVEESSSEDKPEDAE